MVMKFIDIILHLNKHLPAFVDEYGNLTYVVLFLVVFCETGLVITPFLPGDSLLFAIGALAAGDSLNLWAVLALLTLAAILGDTVNYHAGHFIGTHIFTDNARILKKKHLDRTHEFYEKYGGKTIIIARFVPIVRTFAPFVAGAGAMSYGRFILYNVVGAVLWVWSMTLLGYFFGRTEFVQKNFGVVLIAIIVISILPGVFEFWRARRETKASVGV
jgi:membrane-associated protein